MTDPYKKIAGQGVVDWYKELDPYTQGDLKSHYNEIMYDSFASDEIYQTVFAQGSWGDIEDATFETFAEVKTYINDTIFATEHQNSYDDDEYVPSVKLSLGGAPRYLDVSEYYEANVDKTLPEVYSRPSDQNYYEGAKGVLPGELIAKYSSTADLAKVPDEVGTHAIAPLDAWWGRPAGYSDKYGPDARPPAGNIETLGDYQRHLDQVRMDRIQAGKDHYSKKLKADAKAKDEYWARLNQLEGFSWHDPKYKLNKRYHGRYAEETEPLFEEVIGSSDKKHIQSWMAMADIGDLTYENFDDAADDLMREGGKLRRVQFVYDYWGGKLPTREEWDEHGDPLELWAIDRGKSWYEQNT